MSASSYDVQQVEQFMEDAFGIGIAEHHSTSHSRFPRAHIVEAKRVVDNSGMGPLLEKWRDDDGHDPRGPKPYISMQSALIILLMHVREGKGVLFTVMANTLANRLTPKDLSLIGIGRHDGNQSQWFDRLWRTVQAILSVVDPYPYYKKKVPSIEEYAAILADRDPAESARKKERLDYLCHQLVQGSVKPVPAEIMSRYKGNKAQDATFFPLSGKAGNPDRDDVTKKRRSINIDGGYYRREGSHDGQNAKPDKRWWGAELETVTMTANSPGENADFPLLTIGVGCHIPGRIKGEGKRIADLLADDGYPASHWFADLAYLPNSLPEEYQGPLIMHGHVLVNDLKSNQIGVQDSYEDGRLIQVDGQWYVDVLPKDLANASVTYVAATKAAEKKRDPLTRAKAMADALAQLNEHLEMREKFRMKRKGQRRPDGSQQYMYPDPDSYLSYDAKTGEIIPPVRRKTVVVPLEVGLKYGQAYPWMTQKWRGWYGLRSTVEGSYSFVKDPNKEDLGTAARRLARGTTFAYLAATMAVVASNIRRVIDFLRQLARPDKVTAKNRHNPPAIFNPAEEPEPRFRPEEDPPD